MKKVVAVVVTYHPEAKVILPLMRALLPQVFSIVVVDNTPGAENPVLDEVLSSLGFPNAVCQVRLGENFGVAYALNVGLRLGIESGADFLLLSDQDSLPADDMVERLSLEFDKLSSDGNKVGAVGPVFSDINTQKTFPFQVQHDEDFFYSHEFANEAHPVVEVISLITSGTLIPRDVILLVGEMREDFFIDNVDVEWCHRARSLGFRIFGVAAARMYQRLGEDRVRVWYRYWRYESEYSPVRTYYRIRNLIALWRLSHIDWRWKLRNTWYGLGVIYTHVFFAKKERLKHLRYALLGAWHGLLNRMGPLVVN